MTTSYKIVQLVKERISNDYLKASDTDVAKALGISRTAVSHYKGGRDVMSYETLVKANQILQLDVVQFMGLGLELKLEGWTGDESGRRALKSWRDLFWTMMKSSGKLPLGILLAACLPFAGMNDARALENKPFQSTALAPAGSPAMYIMVNIGRTKKLLPRRARFSLVPPERPSMRLHRVPK